MTDIHKILIKYWGYSSYRPLQEDIIRSVLKGNDTMALMPTGGGKSICYQVPALAKDGICLVISPLIALMKDQVDNLKAKGIKAGALYSGMHKKEMDRVIDNAIYGDYRLLYLSPERLESSSFLQNLEKMKLNLIAVDEAHCISQWGYDFRPPYLRIASIRPMFPDVPILALTATAIPSVVEDIQEKLEFRKPNVFSKSFERTNLSYVVLKEEDKRGRLLRIARNVKGTGIVYARNRRQTRELSEFLSRNGFRSTYYHAGLDNREREKRQLEWMQDKSRIMVSTNAFGMGIDKPDVRYVVHYDLPDTLEAYYQEAGRAGRDGQKSWAILMYEAADVLKTRRTLEESIPSIDNIRKIYRALGSYLGIPIGAGRDVSFDFDLGAFCNQYRFNRITAYNALKTLEREGYLSLNSGFSEPSKIIMLVKKEDIYSFQIENPKLDPFLKLLLRSYAGLFTDYIPFYEKEIARRNGEDPVTVVKMLERLQQAGIIDYVRAKDNPQIVYTTERLDENMLSFSAKQYEERKRAAFERFDAVLSYAGSTKVCRSRLLLAYFGETDAKRCATCDICLERNKVEFSESEFNRVLDLVKPLLQKQALGMDDIISSVHGVTEEKLIRVIQWLMDNEKVKRKADGKLLWVG